MVRSRRTSLVTLLLGVGLALAAADTARGEGNQVIPAPGSSRREITITDYGVSWKVRCAAYLPGCANHNPYLPGMTGVTAVGFVHTGGQAYLYQGQVWFNLESLRQQRVATIRQATFRYREFIRHREGMGEPSCIRDLNLVTPNQRDDQLYDYYADSFGHLSDDSWLVTRAVDGWFSGRTENHGFVLRGFDESANPDSDPWGCLSHVTDFELRVVAEVDQLDFTDTLENVRNRPGGGLEAPTRLGGLDPTRPVGSIPGQPGGAMVEGRAADAATTVQVDEQKTAEAKPVQPADLVVTSLQVRGKGVNAGSECRPGENRVLVTVQNAGAQPAAAFAVLLQVDGDDRGDPREVAGLEAGAETVVTFEGVRVRSGEREFRAIADVNLELAEGDEGNNVRLLKVECRDAEDADEQKKEADDKKKEEEEKKRRKEDDD